MPTINTFSVRMPGMHFSWYCLFISEDEKSQHDQKWDELN